MKQDVKDGARYRYMVLSAAVAISSLISAPAIASEKPKEGSAMRAGTVIAPNWYPGKDYNDQNLSIHFRNFTRMTETGPVAGIVASIMFTLDAPSDVVWNYMKDFNSFEGPFGIHYTGVWGEMDTSEERRLGDKTLQYQGKDGSWSSVPSQVVRVVPQHLLTLYETIPADGSSGGISPGFHTVMLNEHNGKTIVTAIMDHAERLPGLTEQEALNKSRWGPNKYNQEESMKRWRDWFVPELQKLVAKK